MAIIGDIRKITIGGNTYTIPTGITVESDPVFSASAAAGITATDISNWNAKVSDDKTWNGVTLTTTATNTTNLYYVPTKSNTELSGSASWMKATSSPTNYAIAKYDGSSYLSSTTPSANDNSTKVATTAYVDGAINTLEKIFIVTMTYTNDTYSFDKTYSEIMSAYNAGKHIVGHDTSWQQYWYISTIDSVNAIIKFQLIPNGYTSSSGANIYFDEVSINSSNQITSTNRTITVPIKTSQLTNDSGYITSYTDTKNTAGSTNSTSTLYLIGATSQETNPQTYSNKNLHFAIDSNSAVLTIGSNQISHYDINQAVIRISGHNNNLSANYVTIQPGTITAARTLTLPDKTGTIALTSDVLDEKVKLTSNTESSLHYMVFGPSGVIDGDTYSLYYKSNFTFTPSTGNLQASKFNGYTLAAACAKTVDSSISNGSSSTNLPTSAAVASFVEGKGYITSISLNGSSTTSASFYAPTTAGTSGQVLTSNGSGAPIWSEGGGGSSVQLVHWVSA